MRCTPYTVAGIRRCRCFRCGAPAEHQWQVCADGNTYRPICARCDVALNRLVLRWMGDPDWRDKLAAYRSKLMANTKKPAKKAAKKAQKKAQGKKKGAKRAPRKVLTQAQRDGLVQAQRTLDNDQNAIDNLNAVTTAQAAAHKVLAKFPDAPPRKPSRWYRFRCAITGLFAGRKHAEENPDTTVRERVKR